MYSVPNGHVLDVGYRPSMWGDIQSCWDGWPVSLCPEWSWEMIFLMSIARISFSHLRCWPWITHSLLDVIKHRISQCRPLMCIITHSFNKTSSKFSVMCQVFFFLPVKIPHVSFQLAVCAANRCCLLDCLCVTSLVCLWGGGICHHKSLKLRGKKFLPCPASRTKEQWKNPDVIMLATSSELLI